MSNKRQKKTHRDINREEVHVKMEAEIGAMLLQEMPGATRSWKKQERTLT